MALMALPSLAQAPVTGGPRLEPDFYAVIGVAGFERPVEVRQSGAKRREDVATGGVVQTFLTDRTRGALVVMTAAGQRRVAFFFPLSPGQASPPLPLDLVDLQATAKLNRIGAANVAGRPCNLWRYNGYLNRSGIVCATSDGIVLQLTPDGRHSPLFSVVSITFARQDPRWFTIPPDYQVASLPGEGGLVAAPAPAAAPPAH
ncbi:MAG TPA: hypothetical protein VG407_09150 [Caulobacteraceae bacterium]|jgi:hypothetical protein|nr:hypothetical protein [Caulobacteraceae bacterium]